MQWEKLTWFKMLEMFMGVMIFALHSLSTIWWGSRRKSSWKAITLLTTTGFCSPIIPLMFRIEPYFYTSTDIVKPSNVFIILYCLMAYISGSVLVFVDAIEDTTRSYSSDIAICTVFFATLVAIVFCIDLIYALKK
ncbi:uncharacterized protein LOC106665198 [Cimex lectularius]|uniref:Uncharacterized protein n=1 Tax=Cimex lectularius TaxID=79782 RepID=A0A8I6TFN1_CIMLE|nr:uncharacterized protein LOC106665198 [Cimex lectularius]